MTPRDYTQDNSIDARVSRILASGTITEGDVMGDIEEIKNPFSVLDYLDAIETYVRLGIRVIGIEGSLDSLIHGQRQIAIQVARESAERDDLTGLYNRGMIDHPERRELKEYAVVMLDIDYFKRINDTYGHTVGDLVIKNVARIVQETLRESFVARYGGEEFYVELNGTDKEGGKVAAERVREAVEKRTIDYVLRDMQRMDVEIPSMLRDETITVSIGVSDEIRGTSPYDVRDRADKALYRAKKWGRNIVVIDEERNLFERLGIPRGLLILTANYLENLALGLIRLSDKARRYAR